MSPSRQSRRTGRPQGRWPRLLAVAFLVVLGACDHPAGRADRPLVLLCGAGLQPAVEALVAAFHEQRGLLVIPDYGGSGLILTRARSGDPADLFMPGDVSYVEALAEDPGRILERADIAFLVPCLIVRPGNPKGITTLTDWRRDGIRAAVGNPAACEIGRVTVGLLERHGLAPADLDAKQSLTVNELGLWVAMGDVDSAVVWESTAAALGSRVEAVPLPIEAASVSRVTLAVLSGGTQAAAARDFLRFCRQPRGRAIVAGCGYRVEPPPGVAALAGEAGGPP